MPLSHPLPTLPCSAALSWMGTWPHKAASQCVLLCQSFLGDIRSYSFMEISPSSMES